METQVFDFEGLPIKVSSFVDVTDSRRWYMAKPFAVAMGYKNPVKAVSKNVKRVHVKPLSKFALSPRFKYGYKQETKFLTRDGLFDLIRFSQKKTKRAMHVFICEVVLKHYHDDGNSIGSSMILYEKSFVYDNARRLDVHFVRDEQARLWFVANNFAASLQYVFPKNAISSFVTAENKRTLRSLVGQSTIVYSTSSVLDGNDEKVNSTKSSSILTDLKSNTVFINRRGIVQLIHGSSMSKAKDFAVWIEDVVLPVLFGSEDEPADDEKSKEDNVANSFPDAATTSTDTSNPVSSSTSIVSESLLTEYRRIVATLRNQIEQERRVVIQQSIEHDREKTLLLERVRDLEGALKNSLLRLRLYSMPRLQNNSS